MSVTFPGWDTLQAEQERKCKEQERKKQEKQRQKEEKRRNSLPPFLMIRAGLLRAWYPWLLLQSALIYELENPEMQNQNTMNVVMVLLAASVTVGLRYCPKTSNTMLSEVNKIQSSLNAYMNDNFWSHKLSTTADIKHKKLSRILTQHISKNNHEIFDKMMKNPESVADIETATNIILGHLKAKPQDAEKVWQAFHCIPDDLLKKLNKLRFKGR